MVYSIYAFGGFSASWQFERIVLCLGVKHSVILMVNFFQPLR